MFRSKAKAEESRTPPRPLARGTLRVPSKGEQSEPCARARWMMRVSAFVRRGLRSARWTASVLALALAMAATAHAQVLGIGRPATEREIAGWNIDVRPDGQGLPAGSGTALKGRAAYEMHCAACHGMKGEGNPADRLVGGRGTLATDKPVMTVGSYWAYATTVYDYINRSMPFTAPQTLKPDEVYSITAYVLHLNGIIGEADVLDRASLPKVPMPNRKGFTTDPRPDLTNVPCRENCR